MDADPNSDFRGDNLRDQLFVRVFTAARVTIDAHWNAQDVCSGYWRLYWNAQAGASMDLDDGASFVLTAGRIHLVPAWVRFTCRNARPILHSYVHFDLIGVTASAARRLFTKPLTLKREPYLEQLAEAVGTTAPPDVMICRAKAAVYGALGAVIAELPHSDLLLLSAPHPVAAAIRHIDAHLGDPISNGELAACCHLSVDHFGRVFRTHLEHTPAQYVLERRIAAATQELAFTGASLEQIAERLGFANRFHLTRMFTRRMGVPPAAYRRRVRV